MTPKSINQPPTNATSISRYSRAVLRVIGGPTITKVIICLYVDDLAILAPSKAIFIDFIKLIKKDFKIKNLGVIKDFLGININFNPSKGLIKLSQATYINKVLTKYNL
jgi:hypothetical protein